MKQLNNINKWFYLLAIGIITSWGLSGCNSNEIPSEFIPEKYLIIDEHEMNIGMASTLSFPEIG